MTRLSAYFEDFLFQQQQYYVAYKLQNLVADFGGLLGLFIGCSLITIVEIFNLMIVPCLRIREKNHTLNERRIVEVEPLPQSLPSFVIEKKRGHLSEQSFDYTTTTKH